MTPSGLPARFPARRLLKIVSIVVGSLALGLLIAIVVLSILREDTVHSAVGWVAAPILFIPGFFVLKMIADSFSVLEVDEEGVRVRKWIGGAIVPWEKVGSVCYWEVIQMVHGAQSREYFLELRSREGKKLLRLKSSYEPAAYECLLETCRARNIAVSVER
jgi:hypothetical protein